MLYDKVPKERSNGKLREIEAWHGLVKILTT